MGSEGWGRCIVRPTEVLGLHKVPVSGRLAGRVT